MDEISIEPTSLDTSASSPASPDLTPAEEELVQLVLSHFLGESGGWRTYSYALCRWFAALTNQNLAESNGRRVEIPFRSGKTVMKELGLSPAKLSQMWRAAKRQKKPLDPELVTAFFPEWLWPAVASLIKQGPLVTISEAEEILGCWAAGLTSDGRDELVQQRSAGTLQFYITALWRLMRCLCELRAKSATTHPELLSEWVGDAVSRAPEASEFDATPANRDRSAPPLLVVRRTLRSLDSTIARKRSRSRKRDQMMLELRDRAIVTLFAVLGLRPEAMWALNVEDFIPEHRFPDGSIGPALRCPPVKAERVEHIKALPGLVAQWIKEYIDYIGAQPGDPLWRPTTQMARRGERLQQQSLEDCVVRHLAPHCDNRRYSPTTLRHFAAKMATLVGIEWIRECPTDYLVGRLGMPSSADTFAKVLLSHTLSDPADRYRDVNSIPGRESLTKLVVEGAWDWIWGDKGARKGPDVALIAEAEQKVKRAEAELRGIEAQLDELQEQATRAAQLDEREILIALLKQTGLARQLAKASVRRERAVRDLETARAAQMPIDDFVVEIPILPPNEIELVPYDEDERPLLRTEILPSEFSWAVGVPASTLRRWMSGHLPHPHGDPRNLFDPPGPGETTPLAVKRVTSRTRYIVLDELDPNRFHIDAWQRLLEVCRRPMPKKPSRRRVSVSDRGSAG